MYIYTITVSPLIPTNSRSDDYVPIFNVSSGGYVSTYIVEATSSEAAVEALVESGQCAVTGDTEFLVAKLENHTVSIHSYKQ